MYCWKCGTEISDTAKFCTKCGTKVKSDDLDKQIKEKQLENEHAKSGCLLLLTGGFFSLWMLFTGGVIQASLSMIAWVVVYIVKQSKENKKEQKHTQEGSNQ